MPADPRHLPGARPDVLHAAASQGEESYPGTDRWEPDVLPVGTRLAQLDYDPERVEDGTRTASKFFTTEAEVLSHQDPETGLVDTRKLSERLQIMASRPDAGEAFEHSPLVTVYEVVAPFPVAKSFVRDNPTFGPGGAKQFYSARDPGELIAMDDTASGAVDGFLKPVAQFEAGRQEPAQPFYKNVVATEDTADPGRVPEIMNTVVTAEHMSFRARLYASGDPKLIGYADGMKEREVYSGQARERMESRDVEAVSSAAMPEAAPHPGDVRVAMAHMSDPAMRASALMTLDKIEAHRASLARGPEVQAGAAEMGPELG